MQINMFFKASMSDLFLFVNVIREETHVKFPCKLL